MSNILNFNQSPPQLLRSVNTPDYEGKLNVLINPDLALVQNVDPKYWKRVGNNVEPMTLAERKAIDDAQKAKREQEINALQNIDELTLIKALTKVLVNKGLITKDELVVEVKEGLNG